MLVTNERVSTVAEREKTRRVGVCAKTFERCLHFQRRIVSDNALPVQMAGSFLFIRSNASGKSGWICCTESNKIAVLDACDGTIA